MYDSATNSCIKLRLFDSPLTKLVFHCFSTPFNSINSYKERGTHFHEHFYRKELEVTLLWVMPFNLGLYKTNVIQP